MPQNPRDAEELAQRDMAEHARRLREFKAKTEGMVWWHDPVRHIDVLVKPVPNRLPSTLDTFSFSGVA